VRAIENLRDGYALKLTIARYYTPNGRSIQAKGVEPDIVVQHSILNEETDDQNRLFKEKDLANHLNAEPGDKAQKQKSGPAPNQDQSPARLSPLSAEQLMTDSRIRLALDILTGYDIFSKLNND
jgi:carboxyl-terminal processing protease